MSARAIVMAGVMILGVWAGVSVAQAPDPVAAKERIVGAAGAEEAYRLMDETAQQFIEAKAFTDCSLCMKAVADAKSELVAMSWYCRALCRYRQLKSLEQAQSWDEYFASGNEYRAELELGCAQALEGLPKDDPQAVRARLLAWQFHHDQQDTAREQSRDALLETVREYAAAPKADKDLLKQVGDRLMEADDKSAARQVYRLYVGVLTSLSVDKETLAAQAKEFAAAGNLDLAQGLYDAYLDRFTSDEREAYVAALTTVAREFAGARDPAYAEKVFARLEAAAGVEAFDEPLQYLRAQNLEKQKEFGAGRSQYEVLLKRFPQSVHADEAAYKNAIVALYVQRAIDEGKGLLEALASHEAVSPETVSAEYQLGLLAQWGNDMPAATQRYNAVVTKGADVYTETVRLAKARLQEIQDGAPMEYNLKMFMDVSLKNDTSAFDPLKADLSATPFQVSLKENVRIASAAQGPQSGCMPVDMQFLWSGHLGDAAPTVRDAAFSCQYTHAGTKEVNVVVVTPAGVVDRGIYMVDAR